MDMRQRYADGFRFPSNGKASPKAVVAEHDQHIETLEVSIPFKREGTWKDKRSPVDPRPIGFNSLQTGRHMERHPATTQKGDISWVSIPFKREGTWKDNTVR